MCMVLFLVDRNVAVLITLDNNKYMVTHTVAMKNLKNYFIAWIIKSIIQNVNYDKDIN